MRTPSPVDPVCLIRVNKLIRLSKTGLSTAQICGLVREYSDGHIMDALERLRDDGMIAIANKRWYWRVRKVG